MMPDKPNFGPLGSMGREHVWGKFDYTPKPIDGDKENIQIDQQWVKENIVMVLIPQLIGIPGAPKSGKVAFHKRAADQLIELFQMWENDGLIDRILTWNGSFCPRFIRGSTTSLSNHAWATAFDINTQWNPLGAVPAPVGTKGSVIELVPAMNVTGCFWGGFFESRKDGMHGEFAVDLKMENPFCI